MLLISFFSRCKETKKIIPTQRKIPTLRGNFPKDAKLDTSGYIQCLYHSTILLLLASYFLLLTSYLFHYTREGKAFESRALLCFSWQKYTKHPLSPLLDVMTKMKKLFLTLILQTCMLTVSAQEDKRYTLLNDLDYSIECQSSMSDGQTPLWLSANKYGLSSLDRNNGYLRGSVGKPLQNDSSHRWDLGYKLDLVLPYNYTSNFIVQQAFIEARWKKGVMTVGSKEWPMELKNNELSSGSQTFGINARPVPQVRIALPEYWTLPVLNGWFHLKGHIAYGQMTDDRWQRHFTQQQSKYAKNTKYHSKAGYVKIGRQTKPLSVELGLEMASQFGGTSYTEVPGGLQAIHNGDGLQAYWHAFIPGGGEVIDSIYSNTSGNNLGSWVLRINYDQPSWSVGLYADHFFEDHSAMFFLDYDGYGNGSKWNKKEKFRFVLYQLKDMILGIDLRLKNCQWLQGFVGEYIYSKYQSGPVYHEHTITMSDHIGGKDNYYNHYIQTGWQHWGQVMGNPLYLSPIYNNDGRIEVKNNRFVAWHFALCAQPTPQWRYRLRCSWQRGYGTYDNPFYNPEESVCAFAEAGYSFPHKSVMKGWSLEIALGKDWGRIYGNHFGAQLTIKKCGIFQLKTR